MSTKDDFIQAYLDALPKSWMRHHDSTEMVRIAAIGSALAAVLTKNYGLMELRKETLSEHNGLPDTAPGYGWPQPNHVMAVVTERKRQLAKGYNAAHDDEHKRGEIARGAAAYALSAAPKDNHDLARIATLWPWKMKQFNPRSKQEDITTAIAMLFAELERLDRVEAKKP